MWQNEQWTSVTKTQQRRVKGGWKFLVRAGHRKISCNWHFFSCFQIKPVGNMLNISCCISVVLSSLRGFCFPWQFDKERGTWKLQIPHTHPSAVVFWCCYTANYTVRFQSPLLNKTIIPHCHTFPDLCNRFQWRVFMWKWINGKKELTGPEGMSQQVSSSACRESQ